MAHPSLSAVLMRSAGRAERHSWVMPPSPPSSARLGADGGRWATAVLCRSRAAACAAASSAASQRTSCARLQLSLHANHHVLFLFYWGDA